MRDINTEYEVDFMKIVVYGLGIIGASLCAAFKRAGHIVYGKNRSRAAIDYALAQGMIDGETNSYAGADAVFLALPPRAVIKELEEGDFGEGTIVADICGVKEPLEKAAYARPRKYRYVGIHPMAGKETSGIFSASVSLFDGANLIVTKCAKTDATALETVKKLGKELGFSRIVECSAARHDEMIAITSQLAHIVSNAYVKSPLTEDCAGFTGGSFQDMTRIAGVDENVWTELFFANKAPLCAEINRLIDRLKEYGVALADSDENRMKDLLAEGKNYYHGFLKKK